MTDHHDVSPTALVMREINRLKRESRSLARCGRLDEAEELCREAFAIDRAAGEAWYSDSETLCALAHIQELRGDLTAAEELYREADRSEAVASTPRRRTLARENLAVFYLRTGRPQMAEPVQRELLDDPRPMLDSVDAGRARCLAVLAEILDAQGRHAEADALFAESEEVMIRVFGEESPAVVWALHPRARALDRRGDAGEAQQVRDRCEAAIARYQATRRNEPGKCAPFLFLSE
jgi:tetratricopeptide (TPR) repeat protein